MRNFGRVFYLILGVVMLLSACAPSDSENNGNSMDSDQGIYGKSLDIDGKFMNVYEGGKGKRTIVIVPGTEDYSPIQSYTNLVKELEKNYHVVLIEPFGYGLSDGTDEPRTSENIGDEIHQAVKTLGIQKYVLLGRSMAGIYALKYVEKYGNEVEAFVGLDTSTPWMNGGNPIPVEATRLEDIPMIPDVEEEINRQYLDALRNNLNNSTRMNEKAAATENLKQAENQKFPEGFKTLQLIAQESFDQMEDRRKDLGVEETWEEQHISLQKDPTDARVKIFPGNSLFYQVSYREIGEEIHRFLENQ
ncbi:alpha/beta hydrolase [Peptoniphilus sp. KCTC 25270]|uniref:alpha/beta fold hydrolase n=1 Tax=Peptoniphilus sp. KCTC 25270 TaxID=2897414 RepID=UPI001E35DC4A|nr:alpha/beta fold hydrolase [Peptoniphilus sp. KCTC 25270]MCD1146558.1 alpha/beta hydrolase [Peptoniphilus sp. KCTC 25270]